MNRMKEQIGYYARWKAEPANTLIMINNVFPLCVKTTMLIHNHHQQQQTTHSHYHSLMLDLITCFSVHILLVNKPSK